MAKPSWLFWVVAILAILWNAFGVYDYWMTSTGNANYLKDFDPEMIEWIVGFPIWRKAIWAISVFAGLIGALALIARRRVALTLFIISFVLMVVGFAGHDILLANGAKMYGVAGLVGSVVLILAAFGFWQYAERAARAGYLA